jgi:hypothetical protein
LERRFQICQTVKGSKRQSKHKNSINDARFAFVSFGVVMAISTVSRFVALGQFKTPGGQRRVSKI